MKKLAIVIVPLIYAASPSAEAALSWHQDLLPPGGCATSIGVGPNDVPFVTGCEPAPDHVVYYLYPSSIELIAAQVSGDGCGVSGCPAVWNATQGRAKSVAVGINGQDYIVGSDGSLRVANGGNDFRGIAVPNGTWAPVSPSPWGKGGCISSAMTARFGANSDVETFRSPEQTTFEAFRLGTIWGLGCDSSADKSIWVLNPNDHDPASSLWTSIPGAATAITMFNVQSPAGLIQTPWIRQQNGALLAYNGAAFIARPSPPGFVSWMTDHFAISNSFSTRRIPGGSFVYRWDDVSQEWTQYMTAVAPNGQKISQIASSEPFQSAAGLVGPSRLWGLDATGGIYFAGFDAAPPK